NNRQTFFFLKITLAKLCCTRYQSTGNHFPVQRLKSYRVQEDTGNCNIRAIIFLTVKGRVFCANPKQQWVIEHWPNKIYKRKNKKEIRTLSFLSKSTFWNCVKFYILGVYL
uniref:Chemokine interleukin-8-like domain-containing protein n=1 Tax=Oryzias latipes TaxID=8090 RepID=A0A3P9MDF7_ORYLA